MSEAQEPVIGTKWIHKESQQAVFVSDFGKMLSDSHWVHCYTYYLASDPSKRWTRTVESFNEKFIRTK